jgi:hypothetical protein
MIQTPYDKYLDADKQHLMLTHSHPSAVVGDLAVCRYPQVGINVVWRMVSDPLMSAGAQWMPMCYVETFAMGRCFVNSVAFLAWIHTLASPYGTIVHDPNKKPMYIRVPAAEHWKTNDWYELDVTTFTVAPLRDRLGCSFFLNPRGTLPNDVLPMLVMGETIEGYAPTFARFTAGSPERLLLQEQTYWGNYAQQGWFDSPFRWASLDITPPAITPGISALIDRYGNTLIDSIIHEECIPTPTCANNS